MVTAEEKQAVMQPTRDKLQELRALMNAGQFHHATYRDIGSLWEGLWIYPKGGLRCGFGGPAMSFGKNDPDLKAAEQMVAGAGTSIGSYGGG